MYWTPVINCPYYESANQLGLSETDYKPGYSPYRARSTCYAGAKTRLFAATCTPKTIDLPRQARDKHRENIRQEAFLAGLVGNCSMPNLILFDYFSETEDLLLQGAERVAREFDDLKPALVAALDSTQPTTRSSNPAIFARSYKEDVLGAEEVSRSDWPLTASIEAQPRNDL